MLAAVQSVPRARHVLRKLGHAALRIVRGRDQVAGGRLAHRRSLEPGGDVVLDQRIEIARLEADVHPAQRLLGVRLRIELDELAVVDLDEDFRGLAGVGDGEGLFVAELAEERDLAIEVADAEGDVRDTGDTGIGRGGLRDGVA